MNLRDREATPEQVKATVEAICARVAQKMATKDEPRPERSAAERHVETMEKLGVPLRFHAATFATSRPLPALVRARQFVETDLARRRALVLCGEAGAGKTHAAVCALVAAAPLGRRFRYWGDVVGILLEGGPARRELLDLLQTVPLLVLDDLGVEPTRTGGHVESYLDRLVYRREADCLPTIITTNLTPEAFAARYSERIVDRLRGWGEVFAVAGEGLRRGDE